MGYVRGFARYRSATDPRTQVPPPGLLPFRPKRARPYLYSEAEIRSLLRVALAMPYHYERGALRPWIFHCLFGLLSVSGLRVGEALNLELQDVDLLPCCRSAAPNSVKRAWCLCTSRPAECSKSTSPVANAIGQASPCRPICSFPAWAIAWMAEMFIGPSTRCRGRSVYARHTAVEVHGCMICVTDLQLTRSSAGIGPDRTPNGSCRSCPLTSAMCTSRTHSGIWRVLPS